MYATLVAVILLSQTPVADEAPILKTVREKINPILRAPTTAQYDVSRREGRPSYPTGGGFIGSIDFINRELAKEEFYTVYGSVDANNALGVRIHATWTALVQEKTGTIQVGCVLFTNSAGETWQVYATSEFDTLFEAGLTKCLKTAFADYAQHVFEVEEATKKLPFNNAKRQTQYWGELNVRAAKLTSAYDITDKELEMAIIIGLKAVWETKEKSHLEACRMMVRRRYKDTALAARKLQSQIGMAQLNATANAVNQAATIAGTQHNNAVSAYMQRVMKYGAPGF